MVVLQRTISQEKEIHEKFQIHLIRIHGLHQYSLTDTTHFSVVKGSASSDQGGVSLNEGPRPLDEDPGLFLSRIWHVLQDGLDGILAVLHIYDMLHYYFRDRSSPIFPIKIQVSFNN